MKIVLLAAACLTLAGPALSQTPEGQRVAEPSPAVEGQAGHHAGGGEQRPSPAPVPVIVVQGPAEAERGAAREAKSDEHDAEDLKAQQRAAAAAEAQWWPAWVGATLSGLATLLVVFNVVQAGIANDIARRAYATDQRAWLSVRLELAGDWNGERRHAVPVRLAITNTGKTPALDIRIWSETVPNALGFVDVAAEQRRHADQVNAQSSDFSGFALFPGDPPHEAVVDIDVSPEGIAEGMARWKTTIYVDTDWIAPALIGCVAYTVTTDGERRETGFIRQLQRNDPTTSRFVGVPVSDEIVRRKDLLLRRWTRDGRVT